MRTNGARYANFSKLQICLRVEGSSLSSATNFPSKSLLGGSQASWSHLRLEPPGFQMLGLECLGTQRFAFLSMNDWKGAGCGKATFGASVIGNGHLPGLNAP
jgi:hypothetical protein